MVTSAKPSLCTRNEYVVISARVYLDNDTTKNGRSWIVSLCADRAEEPITQLAYRFGRDGTADITVFANSTNKFSIFDEDDGPHSGTEIIWFQRNNYRYYMTRATGQGIGVDVFVFHGSAQVGHFTTGFDDSQILSKIEISFDRVKSPVVQIRRPLNSLN